MRSVLVRIAVALERIATALEARNMFQSLGTQPTPVGPYSIPLPNPPIYGTLSPNVVPPTNQCR